jgi:membrane associated rhomboid family serine protease
MHALLLPTSNIPLIGASGAVAGVIAAYVVLHPQVRVWVLAFRFIPLRITAALALGAWIAVQVAMVALPYLVASPQMGPVAWWAHIGGLIAGGVLVLFLRRPGVPLFGRTMGVERNKVST